MREAASIESGLAKQHAHVGRSPEDPSERRRDVAGRKRGRRDLIEERLKQVVVVTVKQRDPKGLPTQDLARLQPAEAAAKDEHRGWPFHCH